MKILYVYLAIAVVALIMGMLTAFCLVVIRTQMKEARERRLYIFLLGVLPCLSLIGATGLILFLYPSHP